MKPTFILPALFYLFLILLIDGCASNEIGESKDVAAETIYQHYTISYNEGDEKALVYAQFRFAGENGTTLVLSKPGKIQFDGDELPVDSSEYEGAYYKRSYPVNGFYGVHHFSYTDFSRKKYNNSFQFERFTLQNIPRIVSPDSSLRILFDPLQLSREDYITIESFESDSSFSITHSGADVNKYILIPANEMQRQRSGELKLVATLFKKIPLQQNTTEGGFIEIAYALQPLVLTIR